MRINKGSTITLQHYSITHPFSGLVTDVHADTIQVRLLTKSLSYHFSDNDPLVLGVDHNGELHIVGSAFIKLNREDDSVELRIDEEGKAHNKRLYERFPVSLHTDILSYATGKRSLALIKDISEMGMRIYTDTRLNVNDEIELSIYFNRSVLFVKCFVVRELKQEKHTEYGLIVNYDSAQTVNTIRGFIRNIKEPHETYQNKLCY